MSNTDLLAVAFTDLNGNGKYNVGKDTLIAALVDTNNDHVVSVGDTVVWGSYPKIPDGSNSGTGGTFLSFDTTVTDVVDVTITNDFMNIVVNTANGIVNWTTSTLGDEFLTNNSHLIDNFNRPTQVDFIFADPSLPGAGRPSTFVEESTLQLGNQGFLDVYIAGWHL